MHNIQANIEMLSDAYKDPNYSKHMAKIIQSLKISADYFHNYASNMLDLSQHKQGRMIFDANKNDLCELLENVTALYDVPDVFKDHANYRSVKLEFDAECPKEIEFDSLKLRQAFDHIIDNLIKYSKECIVTIKVKKTQEELVVGDTNWPSILIEIIAQGFEISEEIFEPFSQNSCILNKQSGLRLSLAYDIICAHKGKIWVESNTEIGCKFNILLPIQYPYDKFLDRSIVEADGDDYKGDFNNNTHILLVDD